MRGKILFVELIGGVFEELNSVGKAEEFLERVGKECNVTVIKTGIHKFEPYGVTGVSIIAESHIALHTWPEEGYMSLLIYTCGKKDPENILHVLQKGYKYEKCKWWSKNVGRMEE